MSGWLKDNVVGRLVLSLGEPEVYTEDEADLAKSLEVHDEKLSASLLAEAQEISGGMQETAQSIESRAMTLQSAVAIATTLTLTAGGLLVDRTKIASGDWRIGFAIVLFLTVVAFIASGLRALGASSRTHPWSHPGYDDIFDHAKLNLREAQAAYAAAHLKSAGMNLRIVQIKGGYLNAAVWWFRIALGWLLVLAVMFAVYTVHTENGSTHAAGRSAATPPGLSNRGRALWNFEALLHDTFGNGPVCTRSGSLNFASGSCSPLATWAPYFYVFSGARHSSFHTIARRPRGSFGNYPVLVRIGGEFISCGPRNQTFLIEYSDATAFTVDCLAPML